jgi:hypothetical protein
VQVAAHAEVEELLRVDEHCGVLAFHAWANRVIQAVHFVVRVQVVALAVVGQAIYRVEIFWFYEVFGL